MKPRSEDLPPPPRLLDQVRERARYLHYSLRTEKTYVYWVSPHQAHASIIFGIPMMLSTRVRL